jgi:pyruvate, water dikinase
VLLTAAYGLGETVVQGAVTPDEWLIFKPTLAQGFRPILSRRLGSKAIRMVRADPPEAGRPVRIEAVDPSDCQRFALSDEEVLTLARWALTIEAHYSRLRAAPTPMDIEWAKDGPEGELFILQARPETVDPRRSGAVLRSWHLEPHQVRAPWASIAIRPWWPICSMNATPA